MRAQGQTKLGFFPLPTAEARKIQSWLTFSQQFSALDPCVGNGVALQTLLNDAPTRAYGIEIDAYRAEESRSLGIETLQADTLDVRCQAESLSLLYLNPPYDWECGESNNQRLEYVFLEHTYRWLKPSGVLIFVIPQPRLPKCARLLAEQFMDIKIQRLTEPECVKFQQIILLATRRKRNTRQTDMELMRDTRFLEGLAAQKELPPLGDHPAFRYELPASGPIVLTNTGLPLDEVEDLLFASSAYRQASRVLLPKLGHARGRPLTPLHGGHVGLLCTAGMLNGIF